LAAEVRHFGVGLSLVYDFVSYFSTESSLLQRAKANIANLNPVLMTDIVEGPDDFHVQVDLPGIEVTNLDVTVANGCLNIRAERKRAHDARTNTWSTTRHDNERMFGEVTRTLRIPDGADQDSADCKYENGVLFVKFLKKGDAAAVKKLQVTEPMSLLSVHPYSAATVTTTTKT
jgi:HSP20 family molecular chaperone IbpA